MVIGINGLMIKITKFMDKGDYKIQIKTNKLF